MAANSITLSPSPWMLCCILLLILINQSSTHAFCPRILPQQQRRRQAELPKTALGLFLTTALEERILLLNSSSKDDDDDDDDDDRTNVTTHIRLFDPTDSSQELVSEDETTTASTITNSMPIYPLPAVYLPVVVPPNDNDNPDQQSNYQYTLRNVEPRNIRMATDLLQSKRNNKNEDAFFCAVLACKDTGRWARVGTILRIVRATCNDNDETEYTKTTDDENSPRVVTLTCEAVGRAEIQSIDNPQAATSEARILQSPEYIRGRVRLLPDEDEEEENDDHDDDDDIILQLLSDYHAVRNFYLAASPGTKPLPPFAWSRLEQGLPELTAADITDRFWEVAHIWQTLCYTVREGHQMAMNADRNEHLVAAAPRPLRLPVHITDIPPADRLRIAQLEQTAQQVWWDKQLDPTADFCALLDDGGGGNASNTSTSSTFSEQRRRRRQHPNAYRRRVLARWVRRERERLTRCALFPEPDEDDDEIYAVPPPERKGAWFE